MSIHLARVRLFQTIPEFRTCPDLDKKFMKETVGNAATKEIFESPRLWSLDLGHVFALSQRLTRH